MGSFLVAIVCTWGLISVLQVVGWWMLCQALDPPTLLTMWLPKDVVQKAVEHGRRKFEALSIVETAPRRPDPFGPFTTCPGCGTHGAHLILGSEVSEIEKRWTRRCLDAECGRAWSEVDGSWEARLGPEWTFPDIYCPWGTTQTSLEAWIMTWADPHHLRSIPGIIIKQAIERRDEWVATSRTANLFDLDARRFRAELRNGPLSPERKGTE